MNPFLSLDPRCGSGLELYRTSILFLDLDKDPDLILDRDPVSHLDLVRDSNPDNNHESDPGPTQF